jgi:hypothetical protein
MPTNVLVSGAGRIARSRCCATTTPSSGRHLANVPAACREAGENAFDAYLQMPAYFAIEGTTALERLHHFYAKGVLARFPAMNAAVPSLKPGGRITVVAWPLPAEVATDDDIEARRALYRVLAHGAQADAGDDLIVRVLGSSTSAEDIVLAALGRSPSDGLGRVAVRRVHADWRVELLGLISVSLTAVSPRAVPLGSGHLGGPRGERHRRPNTDDTETACPPTTRRRPDPRCRGPVDDSSRSRCGTWPSGCSAVPCPAGPCPGRHGEPARSGRHRQPMARTAVGRAGSGSGGSGAARPVIPGLPAIPGMPPMARIPAACDHVGAAAAGVVDDIAARRSQVQALIASLTVFDEQLGALRPRWACCSGYARGPTSRARWPTSGPRAPRS